jgi:hypothetical protein
MLECLLVSQLPIEPKRPAHLFWSRQALRAIVIRMLLGQNGDVPITGVPHSSGELTGTTARPPAASGEGPGSSPERVVNESRSPAV